MALPYPPPWMDTVTLCEHICIHPNTVDDWVSQGILPPPRKRGRKLMWRWKEVDEWLTNGQPRPPEVTLAERIRDGTAKTSKGE